MGPLGVIAVGTIGMKALENWFGGGNESIDKQIGLLDESLASLDQAGESLEEMGGIKKSLITEEFISNRRFADLQGMSAANAMTKKSVDASRRSGLASFDTGLDTALNDFNTKFSGDYNKELFGKYKETFGVTEEVQRGLADLEAQKLQIRQQQEALKGQKKSWWEIL